MVYAISTMHIAWTPLTVAASEPSGALIDPEQVVGVTGFELATPTSRMCRNNNSIKTIRYKYEALVIGRQSQTQISEGEWRATAGSLKVAVLPGGPRVEAGPPCLRDGESSAPGADPGVFGTL